MDRKQALKEVMKLLPTAMPGVAKLMTEKKKEFGADHVHECWRRAMVDAEPGWLYAIEGPIAIGLPWDHPDIIAFSKMRFNNKQAFLMVRLPGEVAHAD